MNIDVGSYELDESEKDLIDNNVKVYCGDEVNITYDKWNTSAFLICMMIALVLSSLGVFAIKKDRNVEEDTVWRKPYQPC